MARGPGGVRHTAHGAPPGLRPSPWPGAGDSPLREPTPLDRTTGPCATLDVMALTERQGAPSLSVAEPSKPPRPPAHLRAATRRWFTSVLDTYVLEPHHVRLLQLAGEAWDRGQEAREQLHRDGLTTTTADGGLKPHPAVNIERDAAVRFARLLRELALDDEPEPDPRLPRRR